MANGVESGSGIAAGLEGLVGGFLMGQDFKTRRQQQAEEAAERRRLMERQQMLDAQAAEDRARAMAFQDMTLATEQGLEFAAPGTVERGVGERLTAAGDPMSAVYGAAPAGFRRVGPSAEQREMERLRALREGTGRNLINAFGIEGASPGAIGQLAELDLVDDYLERTTPRDFTATVSRGGASVSGVPLDQIGDVQGRLPTEPLEPVDSESLRKEFGADPVVKESAIIGQAFRRIQSVATAEPSGANDIAIIFSYMKLVDPGSTVREGEFATAENSQGVPPMLRNLHNRLLEGERLPPEARANFLASAETLAQAQSESLAPVLARYRGLAERQGVDPIDVVYDPFSAGAGLFDDLIPGK